MTDGRTDGREGFQGRASKNMKQDNNKIEKLNKQQTQPNSHPSSFKKHLMLPLLFHFLHW